MGKEVGLYAPGEQLLLELALPAEVEVGREEEQSDDSGSRQ